MEPSELIIKDERVDYMDYDHSAAATENASFGHQQGETDSNAFDGTTTNLPTQSCSSTGSTNTFVPWKIIKRENAVHNQNQTNFINHRSNSHQNEDEEDQIPVFVISEEMETETDPLTPEVEIPKKKTIPAFQLRIRKKFPYECNQCGKQFQYNSQLGQHVAKSHKNSKLGFTTNLTGDPTNPCDVCSKTFKTPTALGLHRRSHFRVKITICKICGLQFNDLALFQTHKLIHEGQIVIRKPGVSCEICGKHVAGPAQLAKHKKIHTKTYLCNFCELIFQNFEDLATHKIIHKSINVCPICNESVTGSREFQIHKKSHDPSPEPVIFSCKICSVDFENLEQSTVHNNKHAAENFACGQTFQGPLYNHTRHLHRRAHKIFSCTVCSKVVSGAEQLRQHVKSHSNSKPTACPLCQKQFKYSCLMENHLKSHFRPLKIYTCDSDDTCRQTFNTSTARKIHKKTAHAINKKYSCDICGKVVSGSGQLVMHKKMRICNICKKAVTEPSQLIQHKKTHFRIAITSIKLHKKSHKKEQGEDEDGSESEEEDGYIKYEPNVSLECPECKKTFKFQSILRRHMQTHTSGNQERSSSTDDKSWECETCNKTFKGPAQLAQHMKTHDPSTRSCPVCGKLFKYTCLMTLHLKTHSRPQKIYNCEECGETCTTSVAMKIHKRTHRSTDKLECSICSKVVSGKGPLVRHMKFHTEGKARTCLLCGKVFKFACLLATHLKVHSKPEREYSCKSEGCELTFKTSAEFKKHSKIHNNENDTNELCVPKIHACEICGKSFKYI